MSVKYCYRSETTGKVEAPKPIWLALVEADEEAARCAFDKVAREDWKNHGKVIGPLYEIRDGQLIELPTEQDWMTKN